MFTTALIFLLACLTWGDASARNVVKTLRVYNGGRWGDWKKADFCPPKQYAIGYKMKIEGKIGKGDDTSLNGIKLLCGTSSKRLSSGKSVTSGVGPWGDWYRSYTICSKPGFMTSFNLQVEPSIGKGDDTAANFVNFRCRNLNKGNEAELRQFPGYGFWGTFAGWSSTCNVGSAICGIETKIEKKQRKGDDTALNDVMFHCCDD